MTRSVVYGSKSIVYSYDFAPRKTLEIAVHPDGSVKLRAPMDTPEDKMDLKVRKRASWILRQQRFFEQFLPRSQPRRYLGGESHLYLGKRYRLKFIESDTKTVKLVGGYFQVFCPNPHDPEIVRGLMESWYKKRAQEVFSKVLKESVGCMKIPEDDVPTLLIRALNLRWGSLSAKKRLLLNLTLIQAPLECIEYVIIHELCHLEHFHHGPEFFKRLEAVLPEWKKIKMKLEKMIA